MSSWIPDLRWSKQFFVCQAFVKLLTHLLGTTVHFPAKFSFSKNFAKTVYPDTPPPQPTFHTLITPSLWSGFLSTPLRDVWSLTLACLQQVFCKVDLARVPVTPDVVVFHPVTPYSYLCLWIPTCPCCGHSRLAWCLSLTVKFHHSGPCVYNNGHE